MTAGAPTIRAEGLSKRYGETLALDSLELAIEPGEVYGYLGPNGAGKTTTIRLLLGLHRPTAGRAELFGIDAWADPVAAHRRVAYVAGEPFLWPALTSAETFEFLAKVRGGTDAAYRDELVERFKLDVDKKVRALSKGNRQKVQLIAALASLAAVFASTRSILQAGGPALAEHRRGELSFAVLAGTMLNQVIRPVTAYWHRQLSDHLDTRPASVSVAEHEATWERRQQLVDILDVLHDTLTGFARTFAEACDAQEFLRTQLEREGALYDETMRRQRQGRS